MVRTRQNLTQWTVTRSDLFTHSHSESHLKALTDSSVACFHLHDSPVIVRPFIIKLGHNLPLIDCMVDGLGVQLTVS